MSAVQEACLPYPPLNTEFEQEAICNPQLRTSVEATPTPNLHRCLEKARSLAAVLNHPQLDTLHVVVEMALDRDGRRSLKRNGLDPDVARAKGLNKVMRLAPSCPGFPQEQIGETHDLLNVLRGAAKIVGQRDEHQAISIEDFMMALLSEGPNSTLEVIREGEASAPQERVLKAIENAVERIAHQSSQTTAIEHRLARIEEAIEGHLRKPGPEPVRVFLHLARVAGFAVLAVGAAFAVYLSY